MVTQTVVNTKTTLKLLLFIYLFVYLDRDSTVNMISSQRLEKNSLHIKIIAGANLHLMSLERL